MRRPLIAAALLVLSGTVIGIREIPYIIKAAAFLIPFIIIADLGIYKKRFTRKVKIILLIIAFLIWTAGFLRASIVSYFYNTGEKAEFFENYKAANPGEFDFFMYLKTMGISSEEELDAYYDEKNGENQPETLPQYIKSYCTGIYGRYLTEHDAAMYKAMLLGDRSDLPDEITELYKSSGISHLLAVSGLHAGIIGLGLFGFLCAVPNMGRRLAAVLSAAAVLLYMLICGASSSVVRASCMLVLVFAAASENRIYDMRSALSLAAVIIMLWRPYQVYSSGFQLSFSAVIAIAIVSAEIISVTERSREIYRRKKEKEVLAEIFTTGSCRPTKGNVANQQNALTGHCFSNFTSSGYIRPSSRLGALQKSLIVSASIQLVTLPVIAWHYYTFPVYGILLNFIVVPLMAVVVYSGIAVLLLSVPCTLLAAVSQGQGAASFFFLLPGLASAPGHYVLKLYESLCHITSGLPFHAVCIGRPALTSIFIYYLIMAAVICLPGIFLINWHESQKSLLQMLSGFWGRNEPVRSTYSGRGSGPCRICGFIMLLAAAAASPVLRYRDAEDFYILALDVGQGDGFLIKAGNAYITIDMGSSSEDELGADVIEPFLLSRGITSIDLAIISHADNDHVSGISYIMDGSSIYVERLALPKAACAHDRYDELKSLYFSQDEIYKYVSLPWSDLSPVSLMYLDNLTDIMTYKDIRLTCIYGGNPDTQETNRDSDVLLLEKGDDFSMLFTGDSLKEDEEEICRLYREYIAGSYSRSVHEADVKAGDAGGITLLKVAHHGSKSSTSDLLLDTLKPEYALLSYGKNNIYGHPSEEVTERLKEHGVHIISTCVNGAVCITDNG